MKRIYLAFTGLADEDARLGRIRYSGARSPTSTPPSSVGWDYSLYRLNSIQLAGRSSTTAGPVVVVSP